MPLVVKFSLLEIDPDDPKESFLVGLLTGLRLSAFDAGEPLLIDWESARRLNPTYELLLEALDWGGITAHFDARPFTMILQAYVEAGGLIEEDMIPAASDAIQGAWVNWLLYNVGRAVGLKDTHQRGLGSGQVDLALSALLRMEKLADRLTEIAMRYAS